MEFTEDQIDRKKRSERFCVTLNIPYLASLPYLESEEEATIRAKDEVVDRTLALFYVGLKSEAIESDDELEEPLREYEEAFDVFSKLTEDEKKFIFSKQPTRQQVIDANWRYESCHVFLWALGFVDKLAYPDVVCNVADDGGIIWHLTASEFREKAKLRTVKEILDETDLIYRLHWACRDAYLNGREIPSGLDTSVVRERHYALNWLTCYAEDWDDITTDT